MVEIAERILEEDTIQRLKRLKLGDSDTVDDVVNRMLDWIQELAEEDKEAQYFQKITQLEDEEAWSWIQKRVVSVSDKP